MFSNDKARSFRESGAKSKDVVRALQVRGTDLEMFHSYCILWHLSKTVACHYEFNTVFWKSCIVYCAKPKEVDPIKLISLQGSVSIALKYEINNSVGK